MGAVAMWLAPFPIPAHRSGRADFSHPALRRSGSTMPHADGVPRDSTPSSPKTVPLKNCRVPRPFQLVPLGEETSHAVADMTIDAASHS
jgi:hypothetical protein